MAIEISVIYLPSVFLSFFFFHSYFYLFNRYRIGCSKFTLMIIRLNCFFWLPLAKFSGTNNSHDCLSMLRPMSSRILSHFGLHGWKTDPGLETERLLLRALLLAVTSLWAHQVGSRNEIYSARWKLTPISDQAKDLVKHCLEGGACMSPFQPLVYTRDLEKSDCESRKVRCDDLCGENREFYGVIWRCFPPVKCGNIMSGFGKCCDCRESHLLCDLPKVLTDKSQVCAVELVLPEYFVPSIKTLRECLV